MRKRVLAILLIVAFVLSFMVATTAFATTVGVPEKPNRPGIQKPVVPVVPIPVVPSPVRPGKVVFLPPGVVVTLGR